MLLYKAFGTDNKDHMKRYPHYIVIVLFIVTLLMLSDCAVENSYKRYMSILPTYPVIEAPNSNQKSKVYLTYPYSGYPGSSDRVDFDDLIYMELPLDIHFFVNRDIHWAFISKYCEVLIINFNEDTTLSNLSAPKMEWLERADIDESDWGNNYWHPLKGMRLRPSRYNYRISNDKFYIDYYNIKRKHFSRYNEIFNSLKVLDGLSFDQMKAIDKEIDLTYWWRKDKTIELHRAVETTRPAIYEEERNKHFLINKITKCRTDLYLIEAERNDSTFLIFSLDGWQHIEGSETISRGKSYDIKIKMLYPDDYPRGNENRHINCYWPERYFFGMERNHYMVYKALDLNGLYLEVAY